MTCIPIVTLLGPVVSRTPVGIANRADALDALDTVLNRDRQPEWGAMFGSQRLTVHLVTQECLRMKSALHIQSYVVPVVWSRETYVLGHAARFPASVRRYAAG